MVKEKNNLWTTFKNLKENLSPKKVVELKANNKNQNSKGDYQSNFTGKSLKKLGVFKDKQTQQLVSPAVSRFSQSYYDDFELIHVPPVNHFPFFVTLNNENIENVAHHKSSRVELDENNGNLMINNHEIKKGAKSHKVIIDYYTENDYIIIDQLLSDLDRQILLFIATFRNVQFLQIVRETGATTKQVSNSLDRLHKYYLVDRWKFKRDPHIEGERAENLTGEAFSIYSNGTTYLMIMNLISREFAYKWREILKEKDRFTPIRCWKIVDAYLNFRLKDDFVKYVPFHYMKRFDYKVSFELPNKKATQQKNKTLNDQAQQYAQSIAKNKRAAKPRIVEKTMYVPELRFNGQFQVRGKNGKIACFDLYPFVTMSGEHSDMDNLWDVFRHFGHLNNGFDENGDKHLLLIIVDSVAQIQAINDKYRVNDSYDGLDNILFLDLKEASTNNILSALKVLKLKGDGNHELKTTRFNINNVFLEDKEMETPVND